jgi:membrane associated rhomboid family serine protease
MTRPCAKLTALVLGIPLRIRAMWILGAWAIWQIIHIMSQPSDNVAYWAHVGGLICGLVLFPLIKPSHVELFECLNPDEFRPQNAR